MKYTNFHPNIKRLPNQTCAVINLGNADQQNRSHFPGYWYPRHCNSSSKMRGTDCELSRVELIAKMHDFNYQRDNYTFIDGIFYAKGNGTLHYEYGRDLCAFTYAYRGAILEGKVLF